MDNPIFKQYLLIFNRLSGSADEMGAFLITLKEHLVSWDMKQNKSKKMKERNQIK